MFQIFASLSLFFKNIRKLCLKIIFCCRHRYLRNHYFIFWKIMAALKMIHRDNFLLRSNWILQQSRGNALWQIWNALKINFASHCRTRLLRFLKQPHLAEMNSVVIGTAKLFKFSTCQPLITRFFLSNLLKHSSRFGTHFCSVCSLLWFTSFLTAIYPLYIAN